MLEQSKVSGFLVELASGATELQVRFALLSRLADIKVVTGGSLLTGIRQGLTALLGGTLTLVALTFASTAVMVAVLFSAIIAERRSELGLLKAIGAQRSQIVGMTVIEAMVATGAGGAVGVLFGVLMLRLFERSLVYHLTQIGIPFVWLDRTSALLVAVACVVTAVLTGVVGALAPAWRASCHDPYDLIRDGN
jgi:putative ABC transport system permease protein